MRKTVLYIVLLAVLGAGVWYFVFKEKDAFSGDEAGFKIEDTASISKIFMADKRGRTVTLERKKDGWQLNGQYKVIISTVNTLLSTLHRQVAIYPVNNNAYNNVVTQLAGSGIKVEIYDNDGDKMRVFYVGGQANENAGTYMLMDGAEQPYVVQIPGFSGYITPRYSTDITDWRDRTVIDVPQSQLASVSIKYDLEPLNNFTLKKNADGQFSIDADQQLMNANRLNKRRTESYSKFFEKLYSEGYINGVIKLDSIISSVPKYSTIDVTSSGGQIEHVDVYLMPLNKRSKNMLSPMHGLDNNFDADRFYAVINNAKDTVIIQRFTFDKIFRKAYEFYQPDDTSTAPVRFEVPKGAGNVIRPNSTGKH